MQKSAITPPASNVLVTVVVETKAGDTYSFPHMDKHALSSVLPPKGEDPPLSQSTLSMVNASFSVLSVPFRTIQRVRIEDGEELWCCRV